MKPLHIVSILALVLVGVFILTHKSSTLVTDPQTPSGDSQPSTTEVPHNIIGGVDAKTWIFNRYIAKEAALQNNPTLYKSWDSVFVPPPYAEKVASCVVQTLDEAVTNKTPVNDMILTSDWRSVIPYFDLALSNNRDQLPLAQIQFANNMQNVINKLTIDCNNQVIPSGELQSTEAKFMAPIIQASDAAAASANAKWYKAQVDDQDRRYHEYTCQQLRGNYDFTIHQNGDPDGSTKQKEDKDLSDLKCT